MTQTSPPRFDRVRWREDDSGFTIGGLGFRVEQMIGDEPSGAGDDLRFYKMRSMVEQYAELFARRGAAPFENVFELGIYHGGSAAFWTEILMPEKYVAIDYAAGPPGGALARYLAERPDDGALALHFGVDQSDAAALRAVVEREHLGHLDLVIDDASHKYAQTAASFDVLFPLLRPGGLYVIEDWSWCYDEAFLDGHPDWRLVRPLAPIFMDLAATMARDAGVITDIQVFPDFVAVARGERPLDSDFHLDSTRTTVRRSTLGLLRRKLRHGGRTAHQKLRR